MSKPFLRYGSGTEEWRVGDDCYIEVKGRGKIRTSGDPVTMYTMLHDYGGAIRQACKMFPLVSPQVIMAMIAIEATRQKEDRTHYDPQCIRFEPGYVSDTKTPHRVSTGLMQTLHSTANWVNKKYKLFKTISGTLEKIVRGDLYIPFKSILLGTGYIHHQILKKEIDEAGFPDDDPVLICSAFNAGSVRPADNAWGLLTYGGNSRMEKFVKFYNDAVYVLNTWGHLFGLSPYGIEGGTGTGLMAEGI